MQRFRRMERQGLYDPCFEHDACGVGFVANIGGVASHDIVQKGLTVLQNLTHRGACGCDPLTATAGMFSRCRRILRNLRRDRHRLPPGESTAWAVFPPCDVRAQLRARTG
jgi:glutamate synthase domain-containing protein 1